MIMPYQYHWHRVVTRSLDCPPQLLQQWLHLHYLLSMQLSVITTATVTHEEGVLRGLTMDTKTLRLAATVIMWCRRLRVWLPDRAVLLLMRA